MKTKTRNACHETIKKEPCTCKQFITNFSKNVNLCILRQAKGRELVVMDSSKYMQKLFEHIRQWTIWKRCDHTEKRISRKIRRCVRNTKIEVIESKIYPIGSFGKFYGNAKMHKPQKKKKIIK